jgi:hypothetical protein
MILDDDVSWIFFKKIIWGLNSLAETKNSLWKEFSLETTKIWVSCRVLVCALLFFYLAKNKQTPVCPLSPAPVLPHLSLGVGPMGARSRRTQQPANGRQWYVSLTLRARSHSPPPESRTEQSAISGLQGHIIWYKKKKE